MQKSNNKLSSILIISILASLALPIYTISFIDPSFSAFITQEAEQNASLIANHMARLFFPVDSKLDEYSISVKEKATLVQMAQEFEIIKVKIYSSGGKIIYSTDPQDVGEINKHKYFYDIVRNGQNFSKVIKKNHRTMEGKTMPVNVVETYIPISRNGSFIGAFEIYNDITVENNKLHLLSKKSRNISIAFAILLLIAISITTKQAKSNQAAQEIAEKKLQEAHDNLEIRIEERTDELNSLNTTLQEEMRVRQTAEQEKVKLIAELTKALDEVKTLSGLLPICAACNKIRNDKGQWQKIESYIQAQTNAEFTHGICPKCAKTLYPDLYKDLPENDLQY